MEELLTRILEELTAMRKDLATMHTERQYQSELLAGIVLALYPERRHPDMPSSVLDELELRANEISGHISNLS